MDFKEIANRKLTERNANLISEWVIPQESLPKDDEKDVADWILKCKFLSEEELEITESSANQILENIGSRKWRSLQVTSAFCHRASIAQQLTNCLSEVFFKEGLKTAKELDEFQDKTGDLKGPLHGLPISLKDNLNVKGQSTTIGFVNFCFNPAKMDFDSTLVEMLRNMGAVFYVKTNVPVAMMMPESMNHIYGNTVNPLNRNLSAGGSSGGEAALLALKGSPLGIGSDIGGSIRIPASFQNLYAIRPSFGRFPTYGSRSGLPGLESVNSVNGPLAKDLDAIELYCKAVIGEEPWNFDPKCIELPWKSVKIPDKLNFAILTDDKYVRPTPPIRRGIDITTKALKKAGHDIIKWDPIDHIKLAEIIGKFFVSDGGKNVMDICAKTGETLFPYMSNYGSTPEMGVSDLWKLHVERSTIIKNYLDRWNETCYTTKNGKPIDAIILPTTPFAGNPHGKFHTYVGYTSPFNLLDYSVGIFPVTRADKNLDPKDASSTSYSEIDDKIWADYDPEETHGGAVALQLVCKRFQEEKVLEILKVLRKLLHN